MIIISANMYNPQTSARLKNLLVSQALCLNQYNAAGTKLSKQTKTNGQVNKTTTYIDNFVFEDGTLKYILTTEGRIVQESGEMVYQYFIKDHLGNNRIMFDQNNSVRQQSAYYPYGMLIAESQYNDAAYDYNRYLYNGKELQDDFELDWYDYGARMYDAQLGRWHVVDPLSEKHNSWSPYNYALNNPINSIDPDGREPITLSILAARAAVGAAIGAGVDISVQMTANMTLGNQGFWDAASNIDWTSVGASAVTGAVGIPGANMISKTAKIATIATVVATDAAIDVSIAEGNQNIFNGEKSLTTATIDVAGSLLGGKVSDDIVKSAKNSISNDISSGTFSTLNKAEKSTLRQTQTVVNSQGFEVGTNAVIGLGSEAVKQGVKSVVGTGIAPIGVPQMQNYTQPIDNTRVEQPIYPLLESK